MIHSIGKITEAGNREKEFASDRPWAGSSLLAEGGCFLGSRTEQHQLGVIERVHSSSQESYGQVF